MTPAVRTLAEATIAASIILNVTTVLMTRRMKGMQTRLAKGIASLMGDAYRQGIEEAARCVATLAERPYDNEPEYSAMLHAEHVIRELINGRVCHEREDAATGMD